jgi:citrate lyase beta subunit
VDTTVTGRGNHPLAGLADDLDTRLAAVDERLASSYPGDRATRQPVHTVYVPADRFDAKTVSSWGEQALRSLDTYGGEAGDLAATTGLDAGLMADVATRVREKLRREPIEDLRVDFEDGYGNRSDDEEDAAVAAAAGALRECLDGAGPRPPYYGIRFKSLEAATRRRGLRTLGLFVEALGDVGDGFVVTLPKVTAVEQVEAMVAACETLEDALGLPAGVLSFEIQVETPQSILGADGTVLVARMIHASRGRCSGLHYGTYDYSASCGIAAAYQSMEHPAADHAKAVMQVAAAGTGVFLSDGSTNVVPVGSADAVRDAWALHARLVRRSLERGFYQGWDLHPAQLPTRFLATYAFYRQGLAGASSRLSAYLGTATGSGFLDEPATAVALAGFVLRGVECGAVDEAEVRRLVGVDRADLARLARRGRSRG